MNKAVSIGVHRKLLSELDVECERVCSMCVSSMCVWVNDCVCVAELPSLIGFMSEDSFSQ